MFLKYLKALKSFLNYYVLILLRSVLIFVLLYFKKIILKIVYDAISVNLGFLQIFIDNYNVACFFRGNNIRSNKFNIHCRSLCSLQFLMY